MTRRWILTLVAGGIGLALFALTARMSVSPSRADAAAPTGTPVERGRYLVTIMGCNDCHTPWKGTPRGAEPDMTLMLSGHPEQVRMTTPPDLGDGPWGAVVSRTNTAWAGPWGVSFTANLTPDPETGLGKWTAETFITALRTGRHEGQGRPILPPMPYPMIRQASDEDLRAIFAYLKSIPPIRNRVPEPIDPPERR